MRASGSDGSPSRILFLINSLVDSGGTQKFVASLSGLVADEKRRVTVASFDDSGAIAAYPLPAEVSWIRVGSRVPGFARRLRDVRVLRRLLRQQRPDLLVSFIDVTNVLAIVSAFGTGIPVVVCERSMPGQHPISRPWRFLRRITYRFARSVVVQTERAAAALRSDGVTNRHVRVIPNFINVGRTSDEKAPREPVVIAAGRLAPEKRFEMLIRAFATARRDLGGWRLVILGEGPHRARLEDAAAAAGVSEVVQLAGWTPDAVDRFATSAIFALTSQYEGFPNVLCEAMAVGTAVVSVDCDAGPREIITDRVDGLLVNTDDENALAQALHELMSDEALRRALGAEATHIRDRLSPREVVAQWLAVFDEASGISPVTQRPRID